MADIDAASVHSFEESLHSSAGWNLLDGEGPEGIFDDPYLESDVDAQAHELPSPRLVTVEASSEAAMTTAYDSWLRLKRSEPQTSLLPELGILGMAGPGDYLRVLLAPPPTLPPLPQQAVAPAIDHVRKAIELNKMAPYRIAVRRLKDVPWEKADEASRHRALERFRLIIEKNFYATACGEQWVAALDAGETIEFVLESFRDTFIQKATGTLLRRSGSLTKFINWLDKNHLKWPADEKAAYGYVVFLASSESAGATAPAAFLSAVGFAKHVLGLAGADQILSSARIKGAVHRKYILKKPLKQRPPLTVEMVAGLEEYLFSDASLIDKCAAGFFLFCLHGRLRFSDCQHVSGLMLDLDHQGRGFLEGGTLRSKTGSSREKRTQFLPVAAPTPGVTMRDWASKWLEIRAQAFMPEPLTSPMLPAPGISDGWTDRMLTSSEASVWLREIIRQILPDANVDELGTHSNKCTPLAWAARRGLPLDVRKHLGYHSAGADNSALVYSRDAMARPLRMLVTMLSEIRRKLFLPDVTRSGFLKVGKRPRTAGDPMRRRNDSDDSENDISGSSSDSSSSSGGDDHMGLEEDEQLASAIVHHDPMFNEEMTALMDEGRLWQHSSSGMIHLANGDRFTCGRKLTAAYTSLQIVPAFVWPRCTQCFSQRDLQVLA